jgi:RNA 2',3'-cyclic 3'-phosphodiesterase
MAKAAEEMVRASAGRAIPAQNLHVTLAFLGSVPEEDIGRVEAVALEVARLLADELNGQRVRVAFDGLDYWKKANLLCATIRGEQLDPVMVMLANTLKSRLVAAGFNPDLKPFRPHVTLARKVAHSIPTRDMTSVVWEFDDFALIESQPQRGGSAYRVLRSFSFVSTA